MSQCALQVPLAPGALYKLIREIEKRIEVLNSVSPDDRQKTQLQMGTENIAVVAGDGDDGKTWASALADRDWEVKLRWVSPFGIATFALYARGKLLRLTYLIDGMQVAPQHWINELRRPEKSPEWNNLITFFSYLGIYDYFKSIVWAIQRGRESVPLSKAA